jgi:hypothetical protein
MEFMRTGCAGYPRDVARMEAATRQDRDAIATPLGESSKSGRAGRCIGSTA